MGAGCVDTLLTPASHPKRSLESLVNFRPTVVQLLSAKLVHNDGWRHHDSSCRSDVTIGLKAM
jgi:hypothetical protein